MKSRLSVARVAQFALLFALVVVVLRMIFSPQPLANAQQPFAAKPDSPKAVPVRARQILIHTKIWRIDHKKLSEAKIDLSHLIGKRNQADEKEKSKQAPDSILYDILKGRELPLLTDLLKSSKAAKLVSEPTLLTIEGREAKFHSGGEIPIVSVEETINGKPSEKTNYEPFGVSLRVTAVIKDDTVGLDIVARDAALLSATQDRNIPTIKAQQIQASVQLSPGQSLVLAQKSLSDPKPKQGDSILVAISAEVPSGHGPAKQATAASPLKEVVASGVFELPQRPRASVSLPRSHPANHATVQVLFSKPQGMQITWQNGKRVVVAPGRLNLNTGLHRLMISNIEDHEGLELYPTLEIAPIKHSTRSYFDHNCISVQFTEADFDQVESGNLITKVLFLPDPEFQELALAGVESLVSTRLAPGVNPVLEADRRGTILAIIRMGNIDPNVSERIPRHQDEVGRDSVQEEIQSLRGEVRQLHNDVRKLINLLE